eukprot:TRINITY_DN639_c2_g1_i7.p4 TRINITY_DN639_c2_g1~~TRINITY_DN639_c2_g1_i7.p4  ORF type:complete len:106 (+),score=37.57 TRINITY_DN639_c2_g1_i7:1179-1496(+)
MSSSSDSIQVTVEFRAGLELCFNDQKKHELEVPLNDKESLTLGALIQYLASELLTKKPEFFIQNDTIRPGILVLVNDADWEILGGEDAQVEKGDNITFISTLHGG